MVDDGVPGPDPGEAREAWQPLLDWVAATPGDYDLAEAARRPRRAGAATSGTPTSCAALPGAVVAATTGPARRADRLLVGRRRRRGRQSSGTPINRPGCRRRCLKPAEPGPAWSTRCSPPAATGGGRLHFNKGLAGAPAGGAVAGARDTRDEPGRRRRLRAGDHRRRERTAGLSAGVPRPRAGPRTRAERRRSRSHAAMNDCALAPRAGAYVNGVRLFPAGLAARLLGPNYARLAAVKRRYDPDGLFTVHHGVGSEEWSADGFTTAFLSELPQASRAIESSDAVPAEAKGFSLLCAGRAPVRCTGFRRSPGPARASRSRRPARTHGQSFGR